MKSLFSIFILAVVMVSCKSTTGIRESAANETLAAKTIIQSHYKNEKNFKSLNIRATAKYKDDKNSQTVSADIRIKKDEIIWINVKVLGFPVAKAIITPEKVSYYEKINNTYFEGNFDVLSNWLGTDLDFQKVQNLLIGNAIDDLNQGDYLAKIQKDLYQLTAKDKSNTTKEFYFEAANFLLKRTFIAQQNKDRSLEIQYPSHGKQNGMFLPNEISILALQEKEVSIAISYKNITFDENLSYSFSIPDGFEQITIDKQP